MSKQIWQYSFPSIKMEGWAEIILREDGFFSAVSDYGNYAHRWSHHGCDDFRKFFLKVGGDYFCSKLSTQVLDSEASFANLKNYLRERKREAKRNHEDTTEFEEALEYIHDNFDVTCDWERFLYTAEISVAEPWEFGVEVYPASVRAFVEKVIVKRLRPAIKKELGYAGRKSG